MRVSYREEPRLYINMKLSFRPTYREMRVFLNYLIPSPYSVLSVHQLLYSVKTWLSRSAVSWNDAYPPPPPWQSRFLFLSVIQWSYWLNFSNSMSDNLWQTLNKRLLFYSSSVGVSIILNIVRKNRQQTRFLKTDPKTGSKIRFLNSPGSKWICFSKIWLNFDFQKNFWTISLLDLDQ